MLERLLIVGLGSIGARHVRIARELAPAADIVVLRHQSCEDLPAIGIDHCVTRVEEAIALHPEAAVIANPASRHLEVAMALASAGIHLLIEKPISNNSQGVPNLIEICNSRRITLMTGYNLRFSPSLQRFRELLAVKHIGRIFSVRAEVGQYLPSWRLDSDYRRSVSAQAALGGGVLLELSHEIDYLRWLFGEVEWVSAFQRKQSGLEIDVEDTAHLILAFATAASGIPVIASLNMDFIRHDSTRTCTVIGETGTLRWDALTGTVAVFRQGAKSWQTLFEHLEKRDDSYRAEWRHFVDCVASGKAPQVSGQDGLSVLRVIDAARLSEGTGAVVRVEQQYGNHADSRLVP